MANQGRICAHRVYLTFAAPSFQRRSFTMKSLQAGMAVLTLAALAATAHAGEKPYL
jgi:hypothetical protein